MRGATETTVASVPATWGGRRAGAGRKRALARGRRRRIGLARAIAPGEPVHVTMRVRSGHPLVARRRSIPGGPGALAAASKPAFRVVHFSVQSDHLHLLVEGADKPALALGLRGLAIRVARAINRALGRTGRVWSDRYHARALRTPREVRHGLVYVLMNFRKHVRHQPSGLDPCSSAPWFDGFRESGSRPAGRTILRSPRPEAGWPARAGGGTG